MIKKISVIILLSLFFVSPAFATINPRYKYNNTREYFDAVYAPKMEWTYDIAHVVLYPERTAYAIDETMKVKYIVRSPYNNAKNLSLLVYIHKPPYNFDKQFTYQKAPSFGDPNKGGWNSGGACISANPDFVKPYLSIPIGDIDKDHYVTGEFKIPITKKNGFNMVKPMANGTRIAVAIADPSRSFYTAEMEDAGITLPCGSELDLAVTNKNLVKTNLVVSSFSASQYTFSNDEYLNDKEIIFTGTVINKGKKIPNEETTVCVVKRNLTLDAPVEYSSWNNNNTLLFQRCKIIQPKQLSPNKPVKVTFKFKINSSLIREGFAFPAGLTLPVLHDPNDRFLFGNNRMSLSVNEGWSQIFETNYSDNEKMLNIEVLNN